MKSLLKGFSLALIIFGLILVIIFAGFDFEVLGTGVKINGLYYVFMSVVIGLGIWLYINRNRFNQF